MHIKGDKNTVELANWTGETIDGMDFSLTCLPQLTYLSKSYSGPEQN